MTITVKKKRKNCGIVAKTEVWKLLNIICTGGPNLHIRIDGLDRNDRKRWA